MRLRSFSDTIAFLSLSLAVMLAKVLHSLVPLPVFVAIAGVSALWLYKTIRGMYAGGSQPAKSDIAADKVAKSLMADLDKEVKAKAKEKNKKAKSKAKASSKTPNAKGRNVADIADDEDDDDDTFLDRAAARIASKKKK